MATDTETKVDVGVRFEAGEVERIDAWRDKHCPTIRSRAAVVRMLTLAGLRADGKTRKRVRK